MNDVVIIQHYECFFYADWHAKRTLSRSWRQSSRAHYQRGPGMFCYLTKVYD